MIKKTIVDKIVVGTPIGKSVPVGFDSSDVISIVDSDYIQLRQVDLQRDSSFVTDIVDSDYIRLRQVDLQRDSSFVTDIVDSDYIQLRETPQDFAYSSLTGAPTALSSFTNDTNFITSAVFDSPITLDDLETTGTSVIFNNLPTTDPLNSGQLWRDSSMGSVLRVSTGIPITIDVLAL